MNARSATPVVLAPLLVACGLHATTGPAWVGRERMAWQMNGGVGTHAQRESGGVLGVRVGSVIDHGVVLKSGMVRGGYDAIVIPGWLVLQPGLDFGAGQPVRHVFDGVGAYGGGSFEVRWRYWTGDREPSFNLAFPAFDVVLGARSGVWMPPEHSNTTAPYFESAVDFGLRFGFGTDLTSPSQGETPRRVSLTPMPPLPSQGGTP
ncbi:MAG TPA: hypothetical protein VFV94_04760 [Polyangiaceae bacterium]|nr:hypothetical protein [Polyangiaceae bacterium]